MLRYVPISTHVLNLDLLTKTALMLLITVSQMTVLKECALMALHHLLVNVTQATLANSVMLTSMNVKQLIVKMEHVQI